MLNLQITLQNLLILCYSPSYYFHLLPCLPSQARCEIGAAVYLFIYLFYLNKAHREELQMVSLVTIYR